MDLFSKYILDKWGRTSYGTNDENIDLANAIYKLAYIGFGNTFGYMDILPYGVSYTIESKIKLPSLNELGFKYRSAYVKYGSIYPLFGNAYVNNNALAIRKRINDSACEYWTRDYSPYTDKWIGIDTNGGYQHYSAGQANGQTAFIRFAKDPILDELSKPNPISILTSGRLSKKHIGFHVTLANSNIDCQEWVIADVNHDNSEGTVDLISASTIHYANNYFQSDKTIANGTTKEYWNSDLREWLNTVLYDGFNDDTKSAMQTLYTENNNCTISSNLTYCKNNKYDKVKAPSITELGLTSGYASVDGSMYPLYGYVSSSTSNSILEYLYTANYWTRSKYTATSENIVWYIKKGWPETDYSNSQYDTVAIIRFGKK